MEKVSYKWLVVGSCKYINNKRFEVGGDFLGRVCRLREGILGWSLSISIFRDWEGEEDSLRR